MTCFPFLHARSKSSLRKEADDDIAGLSKVKIFSYKEVKNATDKFNDVNKIGEGGFGSVYKAMFRDGRLAAVKVLSSESRQGVKEFINEINIISEIHHENLVELYGCCIEAGHRILVYNYLENNSLAQTLLDGCSNIHFSWEARTRICIGVASALAYLHDEVRVVHRDIKASNILLDKDLNPKISDFGLAKLFPANKTHVSTRVAGTMGYLAPEYALRGQVTRKSDIYSFGVLVIEIVSGRCNTNLKLPVADRYLLERVWCLYERNQLVNIVDANLGNDFDAEEACRFLKVGLLCTQDSMKNRPPMSVVVKMLSGQKAVHTERIMRPGLMSDLFNINGYTTTGETGSTNASSSSPYVSSLDTTSIRPSFPSDTKLKSDG